MRTVTVRNNNTDRHEGKNVSWFVPDCAPFSRQSTKCFAVAQPIPVRPWYACLRRRLSRCGICLLPAGYFSQARLNHCPHCIMLSGAAQLVIPPIFLRKKSAPMGEFAKSAAKTPGGGPWAPARRPAVPGGNEAPEQGRSCPFSSHVPKE